MSAAFALHAQPLVLASQAGNFGDQVGRRRGRRLRNGAPRPPRRLTAEPRYPAPQHRLIQPQLRGHPADRQTAAGDPVDRFSFKSLREHPARCAHLTPSSWPESLASVSTKPGEDHSTLPRSEASTWRSLATISSGLYLFLGIAVLLASKNIAQGGPLQRGWISSTLRAICWHREASRRRP